MFMIIVIPNNTLPGVAKNLSEVVLLPLRKSSAVLRVDSLNPPDGQTRCAFVYVKSLEKC